MPINYLGMVHPTKPRNFPAIIIYFNQSNEIKFEHNSYVILQFNPLLYIHLFVCVCIINTAHKSLGNSYMT